MPIEGRWGTGQEALNHIFEYEPKTLASAVVTVVHGAEAKPKKRAKKSAGPK